MDQNELNDKMRLKRMELQMAGSTDQKKKIQNALTILQYQKQIEDLKDKIQQLRGSG
jgi:hypothetical protein